MPVVFKEQETRNKVMRLEQRRMIGYNLGFNRISLVPVLRIGQRGRGAEVS